MQNLKGLKVAILLTNGFEQIEMTSPRQALDNAGAQTFLISPAPHKVQGWHSDKPADMFDVDIPLEQAKASDYDAILLPGGVFNPDRLRVMPEAIEFIKYFVIGHKPIAAICHGPWSLINAQAVKGYKMTSWLSLEVDLKNAGALWVDQQVVVDRNLVTSRKPDDLPAFNPAMLELFSSSKK